MAKTKTFLVVRGGYVGDDKWMDFREGKCPVPTGKMSCLKYVDWLAQRGFGPGYYNNSGRYAVAYKVKVAEGVDVMWDIGTEVFTDPTLFADRWKTLKAYAKRKNKDNPY